MYYSPVRRFTCPRRDFHARLACVKHAASVRSEPGSNSQNKLTSFTNFSKSLTRTCMFLYLSKSRCCKLEASISILIFWRMSRDYLKIFSRMIRPAHRRCSSGRHMVAPDKANPAQPLALMTSLRCWSVTPVLGRLRLSTGLPAASLACTFLGAVVVGTALFRALRHALRILGSP